LVTNLQSLKPTRVIVNPDGTPTLEFLRLLSGNDGLYSDTDTIVRRGLNTDGTVRDEKVLSAAIVDGSVSTVVAAFTSGSTLVTGAGTYITAQSLTITTTGKPILFDWCHAYDVIDNCKVEHGLWRDGTQLILLPQANLSTGDAPSASFKYVDTPAAGTYTYYVKVNTNDFENTYVSNRTLTAVELKK
jgi:hypothetical protein